ncbi:Golgi apparatus membrane protein TVP18, partial [Neolecta irregularis DAH-3]
PVHTGLRRIASTQRPPSASDHSHQPPSSRSLSLSLPQYTMGFIDELKTRNFSIYAQWMGILSIILCLALGIANFIANLIPLKLLIVIWGIITMHSPLLTASPDCPRLMGIVLIFVERRLYPQIQQQLVPRRHLHRVSRSNVFTDLPALPSLNSSPQSKNQPLLSLSASLNYLPRFSTLLLLSKARNSLLALLSEAWESPSEWSSNQT